MLERPALAGGTEAPLATSLALPELIEEMCVTLRGIFVRRNSRLSGLGVRYTAGMAACWECWGEEALPGLAPTGFCFADEFQAAAECTLEAVRLGADRPRAGSLLIAGLFLESDAASKVGPTLLELCPLLERMDGVANGCFGRRKLGFVG